MKNFVQPGDTVTLTAPAGGVVSGAVLAIGSLIGVAATTQPAGAPVETTLRGVFTVPCKAGETVAVGDPLYLDATAKAMTKTATGNAFAGVAVTSAGPGNASVNVLFGYRRGQ